MPHLRDEPAFCMTYGDGVGDVNITKLIGFHAEHGKLATVTAVPPTARFGRLEITNNQVLDFSEKPADEGGVINGGYFVLSPKVEKYLEDDSTIWERAPLTSLAEDRELMAFEHRGYWQPMDTLREKQELESLWSSGKAKWKTW